MHIDEFAPMVTSVEALTSECEGLGAKRRCHFDNGTSLAEEVIAWDEGRMYEVRLSELGAMPLVESTAKIAIEPAGIGHCRVVWDVEYRVKYGPLGWVLGQTLMKMMMKKIIDGNLKGLAGKVTTA